MSSELSRILQVGQTNNAESLRCKDLIPRIGRVAFLPVRKHFGSTESLSGNNSQDQMPQSISYLRLGWGNNHGVFANISNNNNEAGSADKSTPGCSNDTANNNSVNKNGGPKEAKSEVNKDVIKTQKKFVSVTLADTYPFLKPREVKLRITKSCLEILPTTTTSAHQTPLTPSVFFSSMSSSYTRSEEFHLSEHRMFQYEPEEVEEEVEVEVEEIKKPRRRCRSMCYGEEIKFENPSLPRCHAQVCLATCNETAKAANDLAAEINELREGGEQKTPVVENKDATETTAKIHPEGIMRADSV